MKMLNHVTFRDAKRRETNAERLVSNPLTDRVLNEKLAVKPHGNLWTNTIVAYPDSHSAFLDEIQLVTRGISFSLDTKEFKGLRNAALVFDDYELRALGNVFVYLPNDITIVLNFPNSDGWFGSHKSGVPVNNGEQDKYLWRTKQARVGPVVRRIDGDWATKDVFLNHRPIELFNAVFVDSAMYH